MKLKIGALAVVLMSLLYAYAQHTSTLLARHQLAEEKAKREQTQAALKTLRENYNANTAALNKLQTDLQTAQQNLLQRGAQWEALKREHEDLKTWADTLLPDTASRLHQRPAITGTSDYNKWLSGSNPVPPASQQPNNEQRPKPRHQEH